MHVFFQNFVNGYALKLLKREEGKRRIVIKGRRRS
jgi:hypothetical protein